MPASCAWAAAAGPSFQARRTQAFDRLPCRRAPIPRLPGLSHSERWTAPTQALGLGRELAAKGSHGHPHMLTPAPAGPAFLAFQKPLWLGSVLGAWGCSCSGSDVTPARLSVIQFCFHLLPSLLGDHGEAKAARPVSTVLTHLPGCVWPSACSGGLASKTRWRFGCHCPAGLPLEENGPLGRGKVDGHW